MPLPRPATEARRGSLEPGQSSRARSANTRYPAGRPHTPPADRMYTTDVRQHHRLMSPGRGHNNVNTEARILTWLVRTCSVRRCSVPARRRRRLVLRLPRREWWPLTMTTTTTTASERAERTKTCRCPVREFVRRPSSDWSANSSTSTGAGAVATAAFERWSARSTWKSIGRRDCSANTTTACSRGRWPGHLPRPATTRRCSVWPPVRREGSSLRWSTAGRHHRPPLPTAVRRRYTADTTDSGSCRAAVARSSISPRSGRPRRPPGDFRFREAAVGRPASLRRAVGRRRRAAAVPGSAVGAAYSWRTSYYIHRITPGWTRYAAAGQSRRRVRPAPAPARDNFSESPSSARPPPEAPSSTQTRRLRPP